MSGFAQHEPHVVELNVIVTSAKNKKILKSVMVIVGGDSLNRIKANKRGEFELTVGKNNKVEITFMVKGYVSKSILVNTFTSSNIKSSKSFELELLLSVKQQNLNYELLNFPVVKIYYCKQSKKIRYNKAFNTKMKTKYRNVLQKIKTEQFKLLN
jgi:hypothetical protein